MTEQKAPRTAQRYSFRPELFAFLSLCYGGKS